MTEDFVTQTRTVRLAQAPLTPNAAAIRQQYDTLRQGQRLLDVMVTSTVTPTGGELVNHCCRSARVAGPAR